MSQSTPLNLLRRGGDDQQSMPPQRPMQMNDGGSNMQAESQLVEDILKEMGESPGIEHQSNINSQAYQYAMDSSQVPPTKYTPPSSMQYPGENTNYTQKMMSETSPSSLLGSIGINLSGASLKDKIMNNLKYPVLVFIICFLISLPEFNRFLFGFFPRLLLESGQVSIGGVLLKALMGMILYSCIVMFI
jgi:hypothetical protein